MHYRREIDGLRAVAVIPVILFHAGLGPFGGGFAGVDVFFVISGYLIAGIVLDDIEAGRFTLARFYERRIRRIVPALFVMMAALIPLFWTVLPPAQFRELATGMAAAALSAANILYFNVAGYFDTAAELKPLLHTWSLAVEEQFYIVFPLAAAWLWPRGRRTFAIAMIVVTALSFGAAWLSAPRWPDAAFYLPHTRAWELGAGVLAALALRNGPVRDSGPLALSGLALTLASFILVDAETPWPGPATLMPVGGTVLLILFASPRTLAGRLLGHRVTVGLGLISYSAYLWHVPLFVLARTVSIGEPSTALMAGLALLSLALAWASWVFVETPFRRPSSSLHGGRRAIFAAAIATGATFVGFGIVANVTRGLPARLPEAVREIATWRDRDWAEARRCAIDAPDAPIDRATCVFGNRDRVDTVLLGDSHAMTLARRLGERLGADGGHGLLQLTSPGCIPVAGLRRVGARERCPLFNARFQAEIDTVVRPRAVVLFARWTLYAEGTQYDNGEGGIGRGPAGFVVPVDAADSYVADTGRLAAYRAAIAAEIARHIGHGRRVVLVYPVPEVGWDVPMTMAARMMRGEIGAAPLSTSAERFRARAAAAHAALDAVPDHPGLLRVRPETLFCDSAIAGRCMAEFDGLPAYVDDHHPSSVAAGRIADLIVEAMREKGWL